MPKPSKGRRSALNNLAKGREEAKRKRDSERNKNTETVGSSSTNFIYLSTLSSSKQSQPGVAETEDGASSSSDSYCKMPQRSKRKLASMRAAQQSASVRAARRNSKISAEARKLKKLGFLPLPKTKTKPEVGETEVRASSSSGVNFIYLPPTSSSSKQPQQDTYSNYYDEGEAESGSEGAGNNDQGDWNWQSEIKEEPVSDAEDYFPEPEAALPLSEDAPERNTENKIDFQSVFFKVKPSSCEKPLNRSLCLLCSRETQHNLKKLGSDRDSQVVFIMKKMLEVPRETLQTHLKVVGHPRGWVTFCKQCEPQVSKAYDVQKEINELEGKLKKVQAELKNKVRDTFLKNQSKLEEGAVEKKTKWNKHSVRVTKETWSHVANETRSENKIRKIHIPKIDTVYATASPHLVSRKRIHNDNEEIVTTSRRKQAIVPEEYDDGDDMFSSPCPSAMADDHEDSMDVSDNGNSSAIPYLTNQFPFVTTQPRPAPKTVELKKSVLERDGYRCSLCPDLELMKPCSFVKHVIFHQERPFKCKDCGSHFTGSEVELARRSEAIILKEGADNSHVCSRASLIEVGFKCENIWECGRCLETFNSEEERNAHEESVHQNEPHAQLSHSCRECSKKFRSIAEWRLHRALEHHEVSKLSCPHCDEIFKIETKGDIDILDESALRKHIRATHIPAHTLAPLVYNILECDICGENFTLTTNLRAHFKEKHSFDKSAAELRPCPICFIRKNTASLKFHVQSHRKEGKEKMICHICAYEIVDNLTFQEHKLMKHGIEPEGKPPRECTVEGCAFRCVVKGTLDVHMMKEHGAERPHKCQHCGKRFLTTTHLREHERIHLNAETKPYQCDICGNSFALRNYLYIHKRLSHQNRPFASTHKKKPSRSKKVNRTPAASAAAPHKHQEMEGHHFHSVHPTFNVEAIMKTDP